LEDTPGFSVLVVEDDPTHQLLIRKALNSDPTFVLVQFAETSEDAERFARQMSFDALLVDNRIPGRRGLDLISTLRNDGVDAPFVLMTSAGNEDLAVQAYRQNVADYVIKDPDFWRDLPQVLTRVIETSRVRRSEVALRGRLERAARRLDELNTEIQLQNQQLRHAQAELEDRNRKLHQAYSDLGDFTYVVAQTLDRPMRTIREALAAGAAPDAETLERARHAADHLARLRERLHHLSVLSHLRETPTPDEDEVFQRVQADLTSQIRH
jgi:response regulator of citrate/malate metabolism